MTKRTRTCCDMKIHEAQMKHMKADRKPTESRQVLHVHQIPWGRILKNRHLSTAVELGLDMKDLLCENNFVQAAACVARNYLGTQQVLYARVGLERVFCVFAWKEHPNRNCSILFLPLSWVCQGLASVRVIFDIFLGGNWMASIGCIGAAVEMTSWRSISTVMVKEHDLRPTFFFRHFRKETFRGW